MIIKHLVFDFDGTLANTMAIWKTIDLDFLAMYNKTPSSLQRKQLATMSLEEASMYFKTEFAIDKSCKEILQEINQIIKEGYYEKAFMKAHVFEFLSYCKENGYTLHVATASDYNNVLLVLQKFNLDKFFTNIFTSKTQGFSKYSKEYFASITKQLNCLEEEIMFFDDSYRIISLLQEFNFKIVGVYDEHSADLRTKISKISDYYIDDFMEMVDKL